MNYNASAVPGLAGDADLLASALDDIGVHAIELARTVSPGLHGRRRAGIGDSFWEYRHFSDGDHPRQIDWRRSGRSEIGHYFVREKEFETAQTVWLWCDLSRSMTFRSNLSQTTKIDRALLLMLALAQLLVEGGERVAVPGPMNPTAHRRAPRLIAEHLVAGLDAGHARFPPVDLVSAGSACVILSDFLDPVDDIAADLSLFTAKNITLHLVEIADPAEDMLPYAGRVEFTSPEGGRPYVAGRAEGLREHYAAALAAHRGTLRTEIGLLGGSVLGHRTDRGPETALLALAARLSGDEWAFHGLDEDVA